MLGGKQVEKLRQVTTVCGQLSLQLVERQRHEEDPEETLLGYDPLCKEKTLVGERKAIKP